MASLGGAGRSYAESPGCGLPLGNQTSLWFAVYYLDAFDRRIKERYRVRYYVRYMDDCVILHHDRDFLKKIQAELALYLHELGLEFNKKTEIMPLKVGVDFWGWHYALRPTGKVVRRLRMATKKRYRKRIKALNQLVRSGRISMCDARASIMSYYGHLKHGHTYRLRCAVMHKLLWNCVMG